MSGSYKYGLCTDSIHVDTNSGLQVVQMDVAIFCDQIYDTVLTADLRRNMRARGLKADSESQTCAEQMSIEALFFTCIATGKSVWASGGKNTSTAFFVNGWFPAAG